jgi:hypothetical protein
MMEKPDADASLTPQTGSVLDVQDSELGTLVPDELPEGGWRAWGCVAGAYVFLGTFLNSVN